MPRIGRSTGKEMWVRAPQPATRGGRITSRGRATLAVLAVLVLAGSAAFVVYRRDPGPDLTSSAPPTSSTARETSEASAAWQSLLSRLPASEAALSLPTAGGPASLAAGDPQAAGRLYEWVEQSGGPDHPGPLWVQYSLDAELTRHVFRTLDRGRVPLGHVVLMDPTNGRILAYASTDVDRFPPTRAYPAASLVKVVTAAAALDRDPDVVRTPCLYTGNPYRLPRSGIDRPRSGRLVSFRRALATSNNRCFAQLAVHSLGADSLLDAMTRFGWFDSPAPGHAAGHAEAGETPYDVGKLGSGMAGSHITPLHAAQLAASLAAGERVTPRWIDGIFDAAGGAVHVPPQPAFPSVLTAELAEELRGMLVDTTLRGTARSAFLSRGGRPLLGPVRVAGKTGSLTGRDPRGRYEWFIGVAPADEPRIAIAVLLVQSNLWWRTASQISADVLRGVFCRGSRCDPAAADRFVRVPDLIFALPSEPRAPVDPAG